MEVKYSIIYLLMPALFVYVDSRVVVAGAPVIYTHSNGGGADEIKAPDGGSATMQFCVGGNVINAWYTAYDNINDLSAIQTIDVSPQGASALLTVHGYKNSRNARVRIKIYAEIE